MDGQNRRGLLGNALAAAANGISGWIRERLAVSRADSKGGPGAPPGQQGGQREKDRDKQERERQQREREKQGGGGQQGGGQQGGR